MTTLFLHDDVLLHLSATFSAESTAQDAALHALEQTFDIAAAVEQRVVEA